MAQSRYHSFYEWWRKVSTIFLALSFLLGIFSGIAFYADSGIIFSSLMRSVYKSPVSIVGLCCVSILPFLFSAFAVYASAPWLMLIISFGKAFLFAYASLYVLQSFGTAGWLVRWLFLFCDSTLMPALYFFWQRHISGENFLSVTGTLAAISLCFLVTILDHRIISPFFAGFI